MSAPARSAVTAVELLPLAEAALPRYLADLAELVAVDSGSYSPHGVNRVADLLATRLHGLGFTVERTSPAPGKGAPVGDVLVARRAGRTAASAGGKRILLAGHMDTVFEDGTAAERPFSMVGAIAHGPGVSDDKGGLLAGLTAVEILLRAGWDDYAELVLIATPDEEIGSPASRPVTERVAAGADYALALECARENGDLVTGRKGVADFQFVVTGRAAHAGIEPERGANAALAAAHHVVALQELNGRWPGVTVNVGVLRAGTRPNIVCPEAELRIEVRAGDHRGPAPGGRRRACARRPRGRARHHHDRRPGRPVPADGGHPGRPGDVRRRPPRGGRPGLGHRRRRHRGVGDANLIAGTGCPRWTVSDRSAGRTTPRRSGSTPPPCRPASPSWPPPSPGSAKQS